MTVSVNQADEKDFFLCEPRCPLWFKAPYFRRKGVKHISEAR